MTRLIVNAPAEDVIGLAREYYPQTAYARVGELDEERWMEIWRFFVGDKASAALLLVEGEAPIAFAMLQVSREFIKNARLGDVYQFYVSPAARGTTAARTLRDLCEDWFNQINCKARFVSCSAGMGNKNNLLFRNLWAKAGYEVLGTELVKIGE